MLVVDADWGLKRALSASLLAELSRMAKDVTCVRSTEQRAARTVAPANNVLLVMQAA